MLLRADFGFGALSLWFCGSEAAASAMNKFYSMNPATCWVRCNATTDSRAFVAACEAFSSERHPVCRPSIRVQQPPGGVSTIEFGQHVAPAETEALLKSRPNSDARKSGMNASVTSSRAHLGHGESNGAQATCVRTHQATYGFSQGRFSGKDNGILDKLVTFSPATKSNTLSLTSTE